MLFMLGFALCLVSVLLWAMFRRTEAGAALTPHLGAIQSILQHGSAVGGRAVFRGVRCVAVGIGWLLLVAVAVVTSPVFIACLVLRDLSQRYWPAQSDRWFWWLPAWAGALEKDAAACERLQLATALAHHDEPVYARTEKGGLLASNGKVFLYFDPESRVSLTARPKTRLSSDEARACLEGWGGADGVLQEFFAGCKSGD